MDKRTLFNMFNKENYSVNKPDTIYDVKLYTSWLEDIVLYVFKNHYSVTDAKGKDVPIDIAFEDFMNEFRKVD